MHEDMIDHAQLLGRTIPWELSHIFKPDWKLKYNGNTVASLTTDKFLFTPNRKGSYGSVPIAITYDRKKDSACFRNTCTDETIGVLENLKKQVFINGQWTFMGTYVHGNSYTFTIPADQGRGFVFRSEKGIDIARTDYNAHITPASSSFKLLETYSGPIDPWLIALVSHYYAINYASAT